MTLMFTHKATGAWDALTKGLIEAGFAITASWPINTEAEGSLHIKDKAAANSTIFLVCRPRVGDLQAEADLYWEDVEPLVAKAVRARVKEFQDAGISGVDLYLASFGPALEEFSRHWPLKRGTPREIPMRVEQRIGRIDRLGQQHGIIRIVNLHYEGTVETDVYRALRSRIGLFESVVGRLQPILARLPRTISQSVLSGEDRDARERANVVEAIEQQAREAEGRGFDIDAVTEEDLAMPPRAPSSVTMDDLDRIIGSSDLMPPGTDIQPMAH